MVIAKQTMVRKEQSTGLLRCFKVHGNYLVGSQKSFDSGAPVLGKKHIQLYHYCVTFNKLPGLSMPVSSSAKWVLYVWLLGCVKIV